MKINKIVTHDGQAHSDDFLACCIASVHFGCVNIERVNAITQDQLDDPECLVLDKGADFNPALNNFDHHQFTGPPCAVTMLLDHIIPDDFNYREIFPEWAYVETFDASGPLEAAKLIGSDNQDSIIAAYSPITRSLIDIFSTYDGKITHEFVILMMRIGTRILRRIKDAQKEIDKCSEIVIHEHLGRIVADYRGLNISKEILRYWGSSRCEQVPDIYLCDDGRDIGYDRLVRVTDDTISFKNDTEDVKFTHSSGFLISFKGDWRKVIETSLNNG